MTTDNRPHTGKVRHTKCTGLALELANARQEPADITLFTACYSPYSQRVWIALELLGIPYKYYEVDSYDVPKPKELLEVSPKGLVPAITVNINGKKQSLQESMVILEYLEDLAGQTTKKSLLPPSSDPYARALARLQADHVDRTLVPAFYTLLMAQGPEAQAITTRAFSDAIVTFVSFFERAEGEQVHKSVLGLWADDGKIGFGDVIAAPWIVRADIVLRHYKRFEFPSGEKITPYLERLLNHPLVKKTTSTDELYLDSYESYALGRLQKAN